MDCLAYFMDKACWVCGERPPTFRVKVSHFSEHADWNFMPLCLPHKSEWVRSGWRGFLHKYSLIYARLEKQGWQITKAMIHHPDST